MKRFASLSLFILTGSLFFLSCKTQKNTKQFDSSSKEVLDIINLVNDKWQSTHAPEQRSFWDVAAYQTGNMEAYAITKNEKYRQYAETWASYNNWKGATSDDTTEWKYSYGEKPDFVLFGDWQCCFQTYVDLYNLEKDEKKIARAKQVMEYEMATSKNDYWWWADGLYMVMPVMVKLHKVTQNPQYLNKMHEYFEYANSIMYDSTEKLYYRDARYVFPAHKTVNEKKDFWARGNGWVFAALAKVLKDLPVNDAHRSEYIAKFTGMAKALKTLQQPDGYWSRSLQDAEHAPGPETSGTAFFTYGLIWGMNNGYLDKNEFLPVVKKSWTYLSKTAMQQDGKIGYVQPIGDRAIPGQVVDKNSTANFGVGAFLLAACEIYRYLGK
ncbi:glycoside hydrolase family 88/105 protein [Pinibacter aurantiacus]|uniref:Glycoside hydrolase family 88 protein n=1 Tax=Pinibacter aurantiacus TaxID=2851599 RepID=A0A9E2SDX6_9BACT|nr:glycoside hydrolase family 88 protein [Pinibacter aurantiacus]MBV4359234.1 glycoside hydrolase family 88 protein [Pinibacter aurantiacus]